MSPNDFQQESAKQPQQPSGGFFKGLKTATDQLRGLTSNWAGLAGGEDEGAYSGPLDAYLRKELADQFVDHRRFQWLVPVSRIYVSDSEFVPEGYLAGDDDGGLVIFRQSEGGGIQVWSMPIAATTAKISTAARTLRLQLIIKEVHGIRGTETELHARCLSQGCGQWWRLWDAPVREALGADPSLVDIEVHCPAQQRLGSQQTVFATPVFAGLVGDVLVTLPPLAMPALPNVTKWAADSNSIELLCTLEDLPHRIRLTSRDGTNEGILARIQQCVARESCQRCTTGEVGKDIASMGAFEVTLVTGEVFSPCVLRASCGNLVQLFPAQATPYTHHIRLGDTLILVNHGGDSISLRPSPSNIDELARHSADLTGLVKGSRDDGPYLWSAAATDDKSRTPVFVQFRGNTFCVGSGSQFSIDVAHLDVQATGDPGIYRLTITEADRCRSMIATEAIAFSIWQEWDARHTAHGVAQATTADLYSQFNEAKTNNFLLVLYGDIVLLNRSLNAGMSMGELMARLEEHGAASFAEDETLRDATIGKIMLLLAGLTPIKQKFELLATMAPYYWVGQEAKWIAAVFGEATASKLSAVERKRLVPTLRRHIRGMQGDILRSLSHVEAAARPLDAIFAKEELQKHWSSWAKPFMNPFLAQSIATRVLPTAAAAAVGAGSAAAVSTALLPVLASVGAMQAVSMVSAYFAKHREEGAQVRRAAQVIFPWWQVFMKTLAVSLYESREFMAEQHSVAMKRDKVLLESCSAASRHRIVSTLNQQLRRRIVNEKRTRYGEMLEGTGVRMRDLIGDFQAAAGAGMRESVGEFVASLPVARSQQLLTEE
jgi:hypothetical protein